MNRISFHFVVRGMAILLHLSVAYIMQYHQEYQNIELTSQIVSIMT